MAENKLIFSFDVKGQENLARALSEMQKQTQGLGDDVRRLSERSAQDLDSMLKAFQKLNGSKAIIDEIKGSVGELDKVILDSATKASSKVLEQGYVETFRRIKDRYNTLKNETASIAREIAELEQKGDQEKLMSKSAAYYVATQQVSALKQVIDQNEANLKFDDKGQPVGIDHEKMGESVAKAIKNVAASGGGAAGGGGGNIFNMLAGMFGIGGPAGQMLRMVGPAGATVAVGLGIENEFNGIAAQQARSETFMRDREAARRAMGGDVGTMLRRANRQSSYDLLETPGGGSLVDIATFGLRTIYGSIFTDEGGYEYARAKTRAAMEERDRGIFKDLDMGARIAFTDSEANLLTARGFGEETNRRSIQRLRQEGLTEGQSREFRQSMAMYRGSMDMGGAEIGLAMAERQMGMTPLLQAQILRSTRTGSTAGLTDFRSMLDMAGMTDASSIYGRQVLSNYIGQQMDIYGPGSTVAGVGGFAAGTTQALQQNMPGLSAFDAARFGVQGADIASRHMETSGTLINTIQTARLMSMGFGPDAVAMAQSRGLQNADVRKQLLQYAEKRGLNISEDELNKTLAESGQAALRVVGNVLSPETEAAFPGARGTILGGGKSVAGGVALESAYGLGGISGTAKGTDVQAMRETLSDVQSSRQAAMEGQATNLAGSIQEFKQSVDASLREIIESMNKQVSDRDRVIRQKELVDKQIPYGLVPGNISGISQQSDSVLYGPPKPSR